MRSGKSKSKAKIKTATLLLPSNVKRMVDRTTFCQTIDDIDKYLLISYHANTSAMTLMAMTMFLLLSRQVEVAFQLYALVPESEKNDPQHVPGLKETLDTMSLHAPAIAKYLALTPHPLFHKKGIENELANEQASYQKQIRERFSKEVEKEVLDSLLSAVQMTAKDPYNLTHLVTTVCNVIRNNLRAIDVSVSVLLEHLVRVYAGPEFSKKIIISSSSPIQVVISNPVSEIKEEKEQIALPLFGTELVAARLTHCFQDEDGQPIRPLRKLANLSEFFANMGRLEDAKRIRNLLSNFKILYEAEPLALNKEMSELTWHYDLKLLQTRFAEVYGKLLAREKENNYIDGFAPRNNQLYAVYDEIADKIGVFQSVGESLIKPVLHAFLKLAKYPNDLTPLFNELDKVCRVNIMGERLAADVLRAYCTIMYADPSIRISPVTTSIPVLPIASAPEANEVELVVENIPVAIATPVPAVAVEKVKAPENKLDLSVLEKNDPAHHEMAKRFIDSMTMEEKYSLDPVQYYKKNPVIAFYLIQQSCSQALYLTKINEAHKWGVNPPVFSKAEEMDLLIEWIYQTPIGLNYDHDVKMLFVQSLFLLQMGRGISAKWVLDFLDKTMTEKSSVIKSMQEIFTQERCAALQQEAKKSAFLETFDRKKHHPDYFKEKWRSTVDRTNAILKAEEHAGLRRSLVNIFQAATSVDAVLQSLIKVLKDKNPAPAIVIFVLREYMSIFASPQLVESLSSKTLPAPVIPSAPPKPKSKKEKKVVEQKVEEVKRAPVVATPPVAAPKTEMLKTLAPKKIKRKVRVELGLSADSDNPVEVTLTVGASHKVPRSVAKQIVEIKSEDKVAPTEVATETKQETIATYFPALAKELNKLLYKSGCALRDNNSSENLDNAIATFQYMNTLITAKIATLFPEDERVACLYEYRDVGIAAWKANAIFLSIELDDINTWDHEELDTRQLKIITALNYCARISSDPSVIKLNIELLRTVFKMNDETQNIAAYKEELNQFFDNRWLHRYLTPDQLATLFQDCATRLKNRGDPDWQMWQARSQATILPAIPRQHAVMFTAASSGSRAEPTAPAAVMQPTVVRPR